MEKLNKNIHKREVHIQLLIQEKIRLNIKFLPENTEKNYTLAAGNSGIEIVVVVFEIINLKK